MKWNRTNTVIVGIMIVIISTIGVKQGDLPNKKNNFNFVNNNNQQTEKQINHQKEQQTNQQNLQNYNTKVQIQKSQDEMMKNAVVHIDMGDYMGSGLIWKIEEKSIIIASNSHLLLTGEQAIITFIDGSQALGIVKYCSTEYDLGFIEISIDESYKNNTDENKHKENESKENDLKENDLKGKGVQRDILDQLSTVKVPKTEELWKNNTFLGTSVFQYSAESTKGWTKSEGYVEGYEFIPEFYCNMLETRCTSKPGMSGGAIYSEDGILLGMISGGESNSWEQQNVEKQDQEIKNIEQQAQITYSLSSIIIQKEYESAMHR